LIPSSCLRASRRRCRTCPRHPANRSTPRDREARGFDSADRVSSIIGSSRTPQLAASDGTTDGTRPAAFRSARPQVLHVSDVDDEFENSNIHAGSHSPFARSAGSPASKSAIKIFQSCSYMTRRHKIGNVRFDRIPESGALVRPSSPSLRGTRPVPAEGARTALPWSMRSEKRRGGIVDFRKEFFGRQSRKVELQSCQARRRTRAATWGRERRHYSLLDIAVLLRPMIRVNLMRREGRPSHAAALPQSAIMRSI